ncbi:MAG: quinolinate synthase NadA [Candidatus Goldbacteria bacterium]|nr:quinolinate synthase NadA [Candidatus Goldiibacteriota bacterium]
MEKNEMIAKIKELKAKKGGLIVAHNYQIPDIQDIADFTGDSLELARKTAAAPEQLIVFCGVKFMAETAKILSPKKKVLIPRMDAGCPLADTITVEEVKEYRKKYPDAALAGYVNTNAEVKVLLDVCVTSANAIDVVKKLPQKQVVFLPDKNLGYWVKKHTPEKELIIHQGGCIVHHQFTKEDVIKSREAHPGAKILVHPECEPEVVDAADVVGSTSGMIKYVRESPDKQFIIGTEEGHIHRLKKERPDAEFFSLGSAKVCVNMKKTRLSDLLACLEEEKTEVILDEDTIKNAIRPIEKMVEL